MPCNHCQPFLSQNPSETGLRKSEGRERRKAASYPASQALPQSSRDLQDTGGSGSLQLVAQRLRVVTTVEIT